MSELLIERAGHVGRITLNRPAALNALTREMCTGLRKALEDWRGDDAVRMVLIDGAGDRAFCAGGDIAQVYRCGKAGDFATPAAFFRDEYTMNATIHEYPKPVVALMHGFVMGGGVGVGCNAGHRVVGESTRMAMPECGIGLVPDVGGSLLLARAPGRLGEYLGLTGDRMEAGDAIHAGFADHFIPEAAWPALIDRLVATADPAQLVAAARPVPEARLAAWQADIDRLFAAETCAGIVAAVGDDTSDAARHAQPILARNSPLSMAATLALVRRVRARPEIRFALEQEYRFTHRAAEHGDLIEGVRAQIIDKDRSPRWTHAACDEAETAARALLEPPDTEPFELDKVLT